MRWSRRSTALALGTAIGLVFALGGTFVPARVRAILPRPSASASVNPSPPPPAPPPFAPLAPQSTDLQLTELQMFGDRGWSIALHDESKGLVHVDRSGAELREVGPPNLLGWSFVDERTAFVVAKSTRMGSLIVYRTTDRGETFATSQLDVSPYPIIVQGVAFVDGAIGGVLAAEDGSAGSKTWAFLTADGGKSFRRESAPADLQAASPVGRQIWFVGEAGTLLGWDGRALRPILGFEDCTRGARARTGRKGPSRLGGGDRSVERLGHAVGRRAVRGRRTSRRLDVPRPTLARAGTLELCRLRQRVAVAPFAERWILLGREGGTPIAVP